MRHPSAIVESLSIGDRTSIGAFAHVMEGARIGADCNLGSYSCVGPQAVLGDCVKLSPAVQLLGNIRLDNDVFVGPNVCFVAGGPGVNGTPAADAPILVKRGAHIGANATILGGVTIGERAMIVPGALVIRNVPPDAIVDGNPSKIVGYVGLPRTENRAVVSNAVQRAETEIRGVTLHTLPRVDDMRGALTFAEVATHIPFEIKRLFLVYDVPSSEVRGEHAHKKLHQFLIPIHGSCSVVADDGVNRREFLLDTPTSGLHIPPMVWAVQYKHSHGAVLLVLASDRYDSADYIREYDEFLRLLNQNDSPQ
jgi:UDP-2-acetamido-3-amino-2,3-dideoxy-glucuronate N-acetyltransferase